jgi:nicotinamide mononucleotide transporter
MTIPYLPTPASPYIRFFKHDFTIAALIGLGLSVATFILAYSVGWMSGPPNWFEVAGATINYGATYLSIKQRRLAYLLGIVASAAFATAYFQYGLLASSVLSLYLVGTLIYGYFRWGKDQNTRPVHHLSWKWAPIYVLVTAAVYVGAALTVQAFGGQFAFWDAAILVLTIAAQFLLDNKVIETWFVWTLVNIVGVIVYFSSGLYFAAFQQLIFGIANLWGYLAWRKTMKAPEPVVYNPMHNVAFDPKLAMPEYAAADVKATQAIYDAMPNGERIVKGDDGIKRLEITTQYSGDSKVDATYHPHTTEIDQVK